MNSPQINRLIGYVVMFLGFGMFYKGFHAGTAPDGYNGVDMPTVVISIIIIIMAYVWMFLKVRCPHCNGLLNLKLGNIDKCPHCGKNTRV